MKKIMLVLILMWVSTLNSYADEKYKSCTFKFEPEQVGMSFYAISFIFSMKNNISKVDKKIFAGLCNKLPSRTFIFKDATSDSSTSFKKKNEQWYTGLVHSNGCDFDYEFGIKNGSFKTISHYKEQCSQ